MLSDIATFSLDGVDEENKIFPLEHIFFDFLILFDLMLIFEFSIFPIST